MYCRLRAASGSFIKHYFRTMSEVADNINKMRLGCAFFSNYYVIV